MLFLFIRGGGIMAKLTDKQFIFATEYLVDCNATRAYKKAYPKVKKDEVAAVNGNRLLRNAKVKEYIDEQLKKIEDEKIADATEVMKYLTSVMRGEVQEEAVVVEGYGDGCSEAKKIKLEVKPKDRNKAAELLGKRYKLFTEKVEVKNEAEEEKAKKLDNIESILNQMKSPEEGK